jgi:hypothetical protein
MLTLPPKPTRLRRSVLNAVLLSYLITTVLSPYAHADGQGDTLVEFSGENLFGPRMSSRSHYRDFIPFKDSKSQFAPKKRTSTDLSKDEMHNLIKGISDVWIEMKSKKNKTSVAPIVEHVKALDALESDATQESNAIMVVDPSSALVLPSLEEEVAQSKSVTAPTDSDANIEKILDVIDQLEDEARIASPQVIVANAEQDDSKDPEKPKSAHAQDIIASEEAPKLKSLSRTEMAALIRENPSSFLKTLIENKASFEDFEALLLEVSPDAHRKMYDAKMIDTRMYDQSMLVSVILGSAGVLTDVFAMEWFKQSIHNKALIEGLVPLIQKTGDWVGSKVASTVLGTALEQSQNILMTMIQKGLEVVVGDAVKVELFKWAPHMAQTILDHTILRASKLIKQGASALSSFAASKFSKPKIEETDSDSKSGGNTSPVKNLTTLQALWDHIILNPDMSYEQSMSLFSCVIPNAQWILEESNLTDVKLYNEFWKSSTWKGMKLAGNFTRDVGFTFAFSPVFSFVAKRFVQDVLISKVGQPVSEFITQNYYVNWAIEQKAAGNLAAVRAEIDMLKLAMDPNFIPTSSLRELPVLSTIADSIDGIKEGVQSVFGIVFSKETMNHVPILGAPGPVEQIDMIAKLYWDKMAISAVDSAVESAYHPVADGVSAIASKVKAKLNDPQVIAVTELKSDSSAEKKRVRKQRQFFDPTAGGHGTDPSTYDHYDSKTGILSND